ncbi:regulatory LuxR family protein [Mumia flava]|uniref:Regulatory LuxR family protein n=1 Tax=Mumia flava TaxID=1348852 RepID=A0A0B2BRR2_9ACTN|nr:LuxR family transcriptional regulator [Mumia flava]PJJ56208.1 regulatory LuxR family protein [Mumia flava]
MGIVEQLHRARQAYQQGDWATAGTALSAVPDEQMDADDLQRVATTAFMLGRTSRSAEAFQRAFDAAAAAGDVDRALRCGSLAARVYVTSGEPTVAAGCLARARRLADEQDEPLAGHGYLMLHDVDRRRRHGDVEGAYEAALDVAHLANRFHDSVLFALSLAMQGRLLIRLSRIREGVDLLDEAMVYLGSGEVDLIFAGEVYCMLVEGCQEVTDLARAAAWTAQLSAWCDRQPGLVMFTGQSAVHRAQIMRLRGAYDDASAELDVAEHRYRAVGNVDAVAAVHRERGDLHRIRGDLAAARGCYRLARELGLDPQPGAALLIRDEGDDQAAAAAVRRAVGQDPDPLAQARLLPTAVEVLIGADALDEAAEAAARLTQLVDDFGCDGLAASSAWADAQVAWARGDPSAALQAGRQAQRSWAALGAVYESAMAQALCAVAVHALGDVDSGREELAQACANLTAIGALPAAARARALLEPPPRPDGLTAREVEVLALVAEGLGNAEIADRLVLSDRTVARHLSNIFAKIDVGSRTAAAAYAYEHRLVTRG